MAGALAQLATLFVLLVTCLTPQLANGQVSPEVVVLTSDFSSDIGSTTLMTCVGYGVPTPTVSWEKDGVSVTNNSRITIYEELVTEGNLTFVQSILEVCGVVMADSGVYRCTVESNATTAIETVKFVAMNRTVPAEVIILTSNFNANIRSTTLLACVGYGVPTPTVSWEKDGVSLMKSSRISIYEEIVTEGNLTVIQSILEVCSVGLSHSGTYSCTVSGSGTDREVTQLIVGEETVPAEVLILTLNSTVNIQSTTLLACVGYGVPTPTVSWEKDGASVMNNPRITIYEQNVTEGGITMVQSILEVCSVELSDSGEYSCTVVSDDSTVTRVTQLTAVDGLAPAEVVALTSSFTAGSLSTALFTCIGYGVPTPTARWGKDGMAQALMNDSRITIYEELVTSEAQNVTFVSLILEVCSLQLSDSGLYSCTVESGTTTATRVTQLTVEVMAVPAEVVDLISMSTVNIRSTTMMTCVSFGVPIPTVSWEKDGVDLMNNSRITIYEELVRERSRTFVESTLEIYNVELADSGVYSCTAESNGTIDIEVTQLMVIDNTVPAQITVKPNEILAVDSGSTVSIMCVAFGIELPSIMWRRGNQMISNDTQTIIYEEILVEGNQRQLQSVLEIRSFNAGYNGDYECVATNSRGNDTSMFTLTVFKQAELVTSPEDANFNAGDTILLTCVGQGNNPTITWSKSGQMLNNETDSSGTITINHERFYENETMFAQSILRISSVDDTDSGGYTCNVSSFNTSDSVVFNVTVTNEVIATEAPLDASLSPYTIVGIVILLLVVMAVLCSYIISSLRSTPTGIALINLCVAVIALCISFIISTFVNETDNVCVAFSAIFHYTILVSSLAIETMAFFMIYHTTSKTKKQIAITSAIVINWVIPVVIVAVSLAPNYKNYINPEFCRPQSYPYWYGLLLPTGLILLVTAVMLIVIPCIKLRSTPSKSPSHFWLLDYIGLFTVYVFYFIAWGFGLPATNSLDLGVAHSNFQIIFILALIFLGLMFITFYCLLSKHIREAWKRVFATDSGKGSAPKSVRETNEENNSFATDVLSYENPIAVDEELIDLTEPRNNTASDRSQDDDDFKLDLSRI